MDKRPGSRAHHGKKIEDERSHFALRAQVEAVAIRKRPAYDWQAGNPSSEMAENM